MAAMRIFFPRAAKAQDFLLFLFNQLIPSNLSHSWRNYVKREGSSLNVNVRDQVQEPREKLYYKKYPGFCIQIEILLPNWNLFFAPQIAGICSVTN